LSGVHLLWRDFEESYLSMFIKGIDFLFAPQCILEAASATWAHEESSIDSIAFTEQFFLKVHLTNIMHTV
jgi:hypothetical protein